MRCRKTFHYIQRIDSAVVWYNLNPLNRQQSNQNRNQTTPDDFLFHDTQRYIVFALMICLILNVYTRVIILFFTRVLVFCLNFVAHYSHGHQTYAYARQSRY